MLAAGQDLERLRKRRSATHGVTAPKAARHGRIARTVRAESPLTAPGQDRRSRGLRQQVWLARQIRLAHRPVTVGHHLVQRAGLVREHHHQISAAHLAEGGVRDHSAACAVRDRGHATDQCVEGRRGPGDGLGFQRLPAREHEHDQRAGEVLAEGDRRHDRDPGE